MLIGAPIPAEGQRCQLRWRLFYSLAKHLHSNDFIKGLELSSSPQMTPWQTVSVINSYCLYQNHPVAGSATMRRLRLTELVFNHFFSSIVLLTEHK